MKRLEGRKILITGGTAGIGLETARTVVAQGARTAITGISPIGLARATREFGDRVLILESDAGCVAEQHTLARTLGGSFGLIDLVFINAGMAHTDSLDQSNEASFDRTIAVNLKGPYFLIQALLPLLANPATVVLNASIRDSTEVPSSSVFWASKLGLASFARTLSVELAPRGVRIFALSSGSAASSPKQIAQLVAFLGSAEGAFMAGGELVVA